MGIAYHTLYAADGQTANVADRWYVGTVTVTYPSTTTTATGTVAVSWTEPVPMPYTVLVSPVENMTWWIAAGTRTPTGFTLSVASPITGLTGGTVEILIVS